MCKNDHSLVIPALHSSAKHFRFRLVTQWLSNRRVQESKSFSVSLSVLELILQSKADTVHDHNPNNQIMMVEVTLQSVTGVYTEQLLDHLNTPGLAVNQTSSHCDSQSSLSLSLCELHTHTSPLIGPQSSSSCHRLFKLNTFLPYSLSSTLFLPSCQSWCSLNHNVCFLHMLTSAEFRDHPSFMCSQSSYTVDTSLFLSLLLLCVYMMPMFLLIIPCGGCTKEKEAVM